MDFIEKTKIRNVTIAIISLLLIFVLISKNQTVEILYFTNPRCIVANNTDDILREIKEEFKDRINIKEISVSMYADDSPDTTEIKELREKYSVYGVPEIIINRNEYTGKFTKEHLINEICKNFITEPEACR